MTRSHRFAFTALLASALSGIAGAALLQDQPAANPAAIAEKVQPSLVRVQYTLRYDRGEEPSGGGWQYHCPNCGQYHYQDGASSIAEERPAEVAGFLLTPTTVITLDPIMHPRFIEKIEVAANGRIIAARPASYAIEQNAIILELEEPLAGVTPLSFNADAKGPYFAVGYTEGDGEWTVQVSQVGAGIVIREGGDRSTPAGGGPLIVDSAGGAVGMTFTDELEADESWKGSPADGPLLSALDLDNLVLRTEERASYGVVRVTIRFRSPSQGDAMAMMMGGYSGESETEWTGAGVLVNDTTIFIPANLKPKTTARLERITIVQKDGTETDAEFAGTLRDYGAILARTSEPLRGALPLDDSNILEHRNQLLLSSEVRVQGETRTDFTGHARIAAFSFGWRGQVYPETASNYDASIYLFSRDGALVAMPVAQRKKVSVEDDYSYGGALLTPVVYLREALADPSSHLDPNNVPLTEEEENRIAWFGVELQPLDAELARMNNISDETGDGSTGAIVIHIYPGSPAAQAGLEVGDILLRFNVEGEPRPIEVNMSGEYYSMMEQFPWEMYDEIPEQYYEQLERFQPWPAADNALAQKLTDLGFGKPFTLEYVRNGEKQTADFTVQESPKHYASAAKYENEEIGMTVKDLTFEVRRYFQRAEDEPGVIASKIEPGSKASIAGLKPYEIITHINDVPINSVADFEAQVVAGGELRMNVRRMTRGRIVKVQIDPALDAGDEGATTDEELEVNEDDGIDDTTADDGGGDDGDGHRR